MGEGGGSPFFFPASFAAAFAARLAASSSRAACFALALASPVLASESNASCSAAALTATNRAAASSACRSFAAKTFDDFGSSPFFDLNSPSPPFFSSFGTSTVSIRSRNRASTSSEPVGATLVRFLAFSSSAFLLASDLSSSGRGSAKASRFAAAPLEDFAFALSSASFSFAACLAAFRAASAAALSSASFASICFFKALAARRAASFSLSASF